MYQFHFLRHIELGAIMKPPGSWFGVSNAKLMEGCILDKTFSPILVKMRAEVILVKV
jgi:hypothetical protein